jgi:flagellar hook-length control protein FliK
MTSSIVLDNLNNSILSATSAETVGMDKSSTNFQQVFDSTIESSSMDGSTIEGSTLGDVKNIISSTVSDFKEIVKKATSEIGVENSLDLTLARDINDIISQLKDAIADSEPELDNADLTNIEGIEPEMINSSNLEDENKTIAYAGLAGAEQLLYNFNNQNNNDTQVSNNDLSDVESTTLEFQSVENDLLEIDLEDKISKNDIDESSNNIIDEKMLEELNIESITANSSENESGSLMDNQTPQEQAVKVLLSQDNISFEKEFLAETEMVQNTDSLQTDLSSEKIIEQITKQMDSLQNNSKVSIVLNPEALGKVTVQLVKSSEGLSAQFTTTTQEAKELLMRGLNDLKETLTSNGIGVNDVNVKINETQENSYNADWTEQEGSRGGNKEQKQQEKQEKEENSFNQIMSDKNKKA